MNFFNKFMVLIGILCGPLIFAASEQTTREEALTMAMVEEKKAHKKHMDELQDINRRCQEVKRGYQEQQTKLDELTFVAKLIRPITHSLSYRERSTELTEDEKAHLPNFIRIAIAPKYAAQKTAVCAIGKQAIEKAKEIVDSTEQTKVINDIEKAVACEIEKISLACETEIDCEIKEGYGHTSFTNVLTEENLKKFEAQLYAIRKESDRKTREEIVRKKREEAIQKEATDRMAREEQDRLEKLSNEIAAITLKEDEARNKIYEEQATEEEDNYSEVRAVVSKIRDAEFKKFMEFNALLQPQVKIIDDETEARKTMKIEQAQAMGKIEAKRSQAIRQMEEARLNEQEKASQQAIENAEQAVREDATRLAKAKDSFWETLINIDFPERAVIETEEIQAFGQIYANTRADYDKALEKTMRNLAESDTKKDKVRAAEVLKKLANPINSQPTTQPNNYNYHLKPIIAAFGTTSAFAILYNNYSRTLATREPITIKGFGKYLWATIKKMKNPIQFCEQNRKLVAIIGATIVAEVGLVLKSRMNLK